MTHSGDTGAQGRPFARGHITINDLRLGPGTLSLLTLDPGPFLPTAMTSTLEGGYPGPEAYLLGSLLGLKGGLRNEGYAEKTLMVAEPMFSSPLVENHIREQVENRWANG